MIKDFESYTKMYGHDSEGPFVIAIADKKSRTVQFRIESNDESDCAFVNIGKKELTELYKMIGNQLKLMKS